MAVMPYSAALVPTSLMILLAALASEMSKFHRLQRPGLLFFKSASLTFMFALTIAVGGTVSLNGPLGSGRSGFSLKGRKDFKIDIVCILPGEFLIIDYLQFFKM